ncbi:MAG: acyl-CoA dehydrogenase family protein, partial [Elusimicrobiota bacterium]|nr:acyl-CoA dehydrogenase family protein [Elusimicrobiota bacterium]
KYDEAEEYCPQATQAMAQAGIFGLWLPKEYGGAGLGVTALALAFEELSKVCIGLSLPAGTSALGGMPMFFWAAPEQRARWAPDLASGKKLWAFALSEAQAGSDAAAIKTTARLEGDYYILNGSKHYISTGGAADFYTVAVSTNPARGARGISLIAVEKGAPGFALGKKERKMGLRTNPTYDLIFRDCRVPAANLIGGEGKGLLIVQELFDYSRPGIAAQAVGLAQGALDETIKFLKIRRQFDQPVIAFQSIGHELADLAAQIEAGRALVYKITSEMDKDFIAACTAATANNTTVHDELKKLKGPRWTKYSATAKLFCSDVAMKVADRCINLCGGIAYTRDFPLEKYARDAKVTQIYEGTNHIQKNEIMSALIKEG